MNVKRYLASTPQEAMEMIKSEHGNDAIILNSRTVRKKGIKGFFGRPMVEFVVATESSPRRKETVVVSVPQPEPVVPESFGKLEDKMQSLETKLGEMTRTMESIALTSGGPVMAESELKDFYDILVKNDAREELALKLYNKSNQLVVRDEISEFEAIEKVLLDCIGTPDPIELNESGQTVVMVIGPTGVGKTTSLAKLAAIHSLQKGLKTAFITADVYRIGAVEQLKTYADIMSIPVSIIQKVEDVTEAIAAQKDADIIFIDTPGKSPRDTTHSEDMKKLIELSAAKNVFLVISATSNVDSLEKIFQTYENIENYRIILTKTDEAITETTLLNVTDMAKKSVSYVSFGQNVPDDIEIMDAEKITTQLMGRLYND